MTETTEMDALGYSDDALFERNVAVLGRRLPHLRSFLGERRSSYTVVRSDQGFRYLDRHGRDVLGAPDPDYSLRRMDSFLEQPLLIQQMRPLWNAEAEDEIWADHLGEVMAYSDAEFCARPVDPRDALAMVMVDQTSADAFFKVLNEYKSIRYVVICVMDVDLFFSGLRVIDWAAVYKFCDERNIALSIKFVTPDKEGVAKCITELATKIRTFPDMIPVYAHGSGAFYKTFVTLLLREIHFYVIGMGFFRDEIVMFENTWDNLVTRGCPLLCREPPHDGAALIVGSGPSLDERIETVRALSETCLVIAAGTAVEALRAHDIRVDACILLERGHRAHKLYESISKRVDIASVPLIASSTTPPILGSYFKSSTYFFRPALNVASGFGSGTDHVVHYCDPTVTNASVSVGLFLGFRKLILVGVDVGTLDRTNHHSSRTAYSTGDPEDLDPDPDYNIPIPATFGGVAYAYLGFDRTRHTVEQVRTQYPDALLINVSDGGAIGGTVPLSKRAGRDLKNVFPIGDAGRRYADFRTEGFKQEDLNYPPDVLDAFVARVRRVCEGLSWEGRADTLESLTMILWRYEAAHPFQRILRGTLTAMVWAVMSTLARMTPEERDRYETVLRDGVLFGLDAMYAELRDLVRYGKRALDPDDPRRA